MLLFRNTRTTAVLAVALLAAVAAAEQKNTSRAVRVPDGALPARTEKAIETSLDAFFADEDPASRKKRYQTMLEKPWADHLGLSLEDLETIADANDPPGRKKGPVWRVKTPWLNKNDRGWFNLAVPKGYTPAKSWPLVVALHGSQSDGDNVVPFYARQLAASGHFMLFPTTTDQSHMWSAGPEVINVYRLMSWVARRYRIDPRRLIVTGGSMGGMGTWAHLLAKPELWSAGASVAGHPAAMGGEILGNLRGIPFYVLHGEKDTDGASLAPVENVRKAVAELKRRKIDCVYVEAPGEGHTPAMKYWRAMNDWIAEQKPKACSPRPMLLGGEDVRPLWQVQLDPLGLSDAGDEDLQRIRSGKLEAARRSLLKRIRSEGSTGKLRLLMALTYVPGLIEPFEGLDADLYDDSDGWVTRPENAALRQMGMALRAREGKGSLPDLFDAALHTYRARIYARRFARGVEADKDSPLKWAGDFNAASGAVRQALQAQPAYGPALKVLRAVNSRLPTLPRKPR